MSAVAGFGPPPAPPPPRGPLAARAALGIVTVALLLLLAVWLRASEHEATAARLTGEDPANASQGDAARALAALTEAERGQPDAGPRQARGVILLARGETAAAARMFEAVVEAEPRNGVAWGYLVTTLRELDPPRSREAARRAGELIPDLRDR